MDRNRIPAAEHAAGDIVEGFRVERITPIEDVKALCYECSHLGTGARLVHLHCDDRENLYSITLRTPPADAAGEAHILEHCALAGSRKYPLKDVFAELSKASLNTFLNAMTYGDKTIYPVCSAIHADYRNLADVYTDLVFHPLKARRTFMQEGHHFAFEKEGDASSDLTIGGVVYNEMKGAMSSPERIMYETIGARLLPDTPYAHNSGGDPERIPDLSYEDFVEFHERYYHPSNALWILYGDIPLAEHLAFVDKRIKGFKKIDPRSGIPLQARWDSPRRSTVPYPVGSGDDMAGKTSHGMAWMCADATQTEEIVALNVLAEALLGNAAGPLRKAVIDSGLGKDIFGAGIWNHTLQNAFALILRGSEPDRAQAFERLVLDTLRDIADRGIPTDILEAAFATLEFRAREIGNAFPVDLMERMVEPANYGVAPTTYLALGSRLAALRETWLATPELFKNLAKRWLVDNPHYVVVSGIPSRTLAAEQSAAFKKRMAELKAGMSEERLAEIAREQVELRIHQETPDTPEVLATVPHIALKDVPASVPPFPEEEPAGGLLVHPVFSNGIVAVDLSFDISDLGADDLLLVPFLGKATVECGAAGMDYAAMATRIAAATGGLEYVARGVTGSAGTSAALVLRGSAVARKAQDLFAIMGDVCRSADYADAKRIKDLAGEAFNQMRQSLVQGGTQYAAMAANACHGSGLRKQELMNGFSQIERLRDLSALDADGLAEIGSRLKALAARVFTASRCIVNICADPEAMPAALDEARAFRASLPGGAPIRGIDIPASERRALGIAVQTQVSFVAKSFPLGGYGHIAAPAFKALASIASDDYCYKKLRVQGGAYGGWARYQPNQPGVFHLGSYRDPRLSATIGDMNGLSAWARSPELSREVLDKARIGIIGELDAIYSPKSASFISLMNKLSGITPADEEAFRESIFSVSLDDIRSRAVDSVEAALRSAPKAVVASREAIEKANTELAAIGEAPFGIVSLES